MLVNAAGPWASALADRVTPKVPVPALELVQGTHLVLEGPPQCGVYYLESPRDGRAIFVMPWHSQLLLGTTEVRFHGDPAAVEPGPHEIHYLLGVLALTIFPATGTRQHPRSSEPLRACARFPPGAVTPFTAPTGETLLIPIVTLGRACYRSTAESDHLGAVARALGQMASSLPQRRPVARTDQLKLHPA